MSNSKTALVCGAGGFIGHHLVNQLKKAGYFVIGADLKKPEFEASKADEFFIVDLRLQSSWTALMEIYHYDEIYQLAADMGGAGYIFTGEHDADIMASSAQININCIANAIKWTEHRRTLEATVIAPRIFYSSSACIYPAHNQTDPSNPNCEESSAYPANPDSEYGWEKLFSERLYLSFARNYGIEVRIARFHNIYGPMGTWNGGKEKAPAAMCRKAALANEVDTIEVWGDGKQTRSFLYIDACIEGIRRLMQSDFTGPVNIGSDQMVTINELAEIAIALSGKNIAIKNIEGPTGVAGRNSDNKLIRSKLNWVPEYSLYKGVMHTYYWIKEQINQSKS